MTDIAFFCGYKVPPKRYISYFSKLNLVFDPLISGNESKSKKYPIIITHSYGIINALMYCEELVYFPTLIIAIDPPDISIDNIKSKLLSDLSVDLKTSYNRYLEQKISLDNYNIYVYRNINKKNYLDTGSYKNVYWYNFESHYPYTNKKIRDDIYALIKKNNK
jgi:hypothetical protein